METSTKSTHTSSTQDGPARPRVLIVEDESLVAWSLASSLSKIGFEVSVVDSGEKAVERLSESTYGLVITDLKLPRINGLAVAAAAKSVKPPVPVIVVSALLEDDGAEIRSCPSVDCVIEKPFDLGELSMLAVRYSTRSR